MSSSVVPFKNQRYAELKRDCIKRKRLFRDPQFPADDSSLFYKEPPPGEVEWKRPWISSDPHLFVEGVDSHDLNQGLIENCWFVAASSCLALKPYLWQKVIPDWQEQEWDPIHPENYVGIFHFQFWVFGQWTDVVVNDRLPTINGQLIYSIAFFFFYLRLYGCYESLRGGDTGDAVADFTGAVFERTDLRKKALYKDQKKQYYLFENLLKIYEDGGIISCGISVCTFKKANDLVKGHAYSVTAVKRICLGHEAAYFKNETIPMIQMRNPWGITEWNGSWSDRHNLGLTVEDDGEFWMSFGDWCGHFTKADICHIFDNLLTTFKSNSDLNCLLNCLFQYLFDVTKITDEVLINLQQEDQRIKKKNCVWKVELNRNSEMQRTRKQTGKKSFSSHRSVFMRCNLPQGQYVVVPSTSDPGEQRKFMLRIFTNVDPGLDKYISLLFSSNTAFLFRWKCKIVHFLPRGIIHNSQTQKWGQHQSPPLPGLQTATKWLHFATKI
uniref:Calpain catalytic domain-containing protein n=1 Tax=Oryzias sinensis TaxID=183150 RepID=A0A8C8DHD4_9TELE